MCPKIAGKTFSSDLRKPCLITGESLSPPTKIGPVHEKITYYITKTGWEVYTYKNGFGYPLPNWILINWLAIWLLIKDLVIKNWVDYQIWIRVLITKSNTDYLFSTGENYGLIVQHTQDCPIFFVQLNYVQK